MASQNIRAQCTLATAVEGAIGPATLDLIERSIVKGNELNCASHLLLINTPGGNLQTTRLIVEKIVNSPKPFICLVFPSGGHAGSAGAIILQACHISGAMEATNIGAATPIASTGQEMAEDLRKKLINDTLSWVEGLAKLRGRSLKFAREIIESAKAVDAKEALELKAIDTVVQKREEILEFAQDKEVQLLGGAKAKIETGEITYFGSDLRYEFLQFITDPQFSYFIFMGSLGLLYFELTHPGALVPGIVGGIGLVISMISFHKLNVEWAGLVLILLGLALMLAEAFTPSFGALGAGGIVAFVFGSILLYDPVRTGVSLPLSVLISTSSFLGLITLGIAYMAYSSRGQSRRSKTGKLKDQEGQVVELSEDQKSGQLEVMGETWRFQSQKPVVIGETVKVLRREGLTVFIEKK